MKIFHLHTPRICSRSMGCHERTCIGLSPSIDSSGGNRAEATRAFVENELTLLLGLQIRDNPRSSPRKANNEKREQLLGEGTMIIGANWPGYFMAKNGKCHRRSVELLMTAVGNLSSCEAGFASRSWGDNRNEKLH